MACVGVGQSGSIRLGGGEGQQAERDRSASAAVLLPPAAIARTSTARRGPASRSPVCVSY